jgi:hypothetical protein
MWLLKMKECSFEETFILTPQHQLSCSEWQIHHYTPLRSMPHTADIFARLTFKKFHASYALNGSNLDVFIFMVTDYGTVKLNNLYFFCWQNFLSCYQTHNYTNKWCFSVIKICLAEWNLDNVLPEVWLLLIILSWSKHIPKLEGFCSSNYVLFCWWLLC